MGVIDDIMKGRKPRTMQDAAASPALGPAIDTARRLAQQSQQKRAAASQAAADAAKEQQWMTGQRRMNGDGEQVLQQGAGFVASPDIATRQMTPGGVLPQPGPTMTAAQPQPTGQATAVTEVSQPQVADMEGLIGYLGKDAKQKLDDATETAEQKAAREKREKRQALMAKIGDGLSAFHEAYSYMRERKPMTSGSMTAAQEARAKMLGLERDKKYKDALDNYLKIIEAQRKNEYYNSIAETRRATQESLDRDREEKRRETARLNNARIDLYNARKGKYLDESSYTLAFNNAIASGLPESEAIKAGLAASAESQRVLAEQQQRESDAKVAAGQAQARQRDAAANASNARADKTRASGSSSGGTVTTTTTTYDKNGKVKGTKVTTRKRGGGGGGSSRGRGNGNGNKNKYSNVKAK